MISVKNLTKRFVFFTAVDSISFDVKIGETVGFLGPNGAGKSTTIKMLTSFITPSAGSIFIDGINIADNSELTRSLIGYLPENAPLYKDMTVMEFLKFCAKIRGIGKKEIKNSMEKVIESCSLKKVLHQTIDTLSKGYLRRTALAQALIHDPPYLILDEPTDGLDPNQKFHIYELIKQMSAHKAILLSTHILGEARECCSKVIIVTRGKITAEGTVEELKDKHGGTLFNAFRELTL